MRLIVGRRPPLSLQKSASNSRKSIIAFDYAYSINPENSKSQNTRVSKKDIFATAKKRDCNKENGGLEHKCNNSETYQFRHKKSKAVKPCFSLVDISSRVSRTRKSFAVFIFLVCVVHIVKHISMRRSQIKRVMADEHIIFC